MMSQVRSIVLAGVGGQGTILMSKVLTQGLVDAGYDVKMSEVHGMSQRGGSVSTQVRFGEKVHSPIIGEAQADLLVAFEKLEAARYAKYLKPGGIVIVNTYEIPPMPVSSGAELYPDGILEALMAHFATIPIDAAAVALKSGNSRTMNMVLLGVTVRTLGMQKIDWEKVLATILQPAYLDENLKAYRAGLAYSA
jgi:indolepyruvate ferredoxin oxidoreductase beta subunit